MKNPKKSFALLLAVLLITLFSFLSVYILEIRTFQSDTQTKNHHQIQASFHLDFAKNFINNLDLNKVNENCVEEIDISNNNYEIYANISYISDKSNCQNSQKIELDSNYSHGVAIVDLYIKSKSKHFKIKLHERFLKKL